MVVGMSISSPHSAVIKVPAHDHEHITAPSGEVIQVDVVTLAGQQSSNGMNLGIVDTRGQTVSKFDKQEDAIEKSGSGRINGPFTIDEHIGLLVTNNTDDDLTCGVLAKTV